MDQSQSDVPSKSVGLGVTLSSDTKKFLTRLTILVVCAIIYAAILRGRSTQTSLKCSLLRALNEAVELYNLLKEKI